MAAGTSFPDSSLPPANPSLFPLSLHLPLHSREAFLLQASFNLTASEVVRRMPLKTIPLTIAANPEGRYCKDFLKRKRWESAQKWPAFSLLNDDKWKELLLDCNVHHKTPREFGGRNNFDNLVLIDRDVHQALHRAIAKIFTEAGEVIHKRYPKLRGEDKTLVRWISTRRNLAPLQNDLKRVAGLSFDRAGKVSISIPYPEEDVLISRHLTKQLPKVAKTLCPSLNLSYV